MVACVLFRSGSGYEGAAVNAVLHWGQLMGRFLRLLSLSQKEKLETPVL
jgi:hypothetical protein